MAAIARLAAETLREAWTEAGFVGMFEERGTVWLVARRPGAAAPVGFLLAQRVADELHVLSLSVSEAFRRRGVARALLAEARGDPPSKRVLLEVRPTNAPARDFYRALGFEEVGRRRAYYPDGEDALLLTRGEKPASERTAAGERRRA
jgi:ribosomal-protein-alanine N-acetyltransferase